MIKYYLQTTLHMKSGKTLKFDTNIGDSKETCCDVGNDMISTYRDYCKKGGSGYFNFGPKYFNAVEIEGIECILRKKFLWFKLP